MKIQLLILTTFGVFFSTQIFAQIHGVVYSYDEFGNKEVINGAQIQLLQSQTRTKTDSDGHFEIAGPNTLPDTLVFSFVGHISDSLVITENEHLELEITLFQNNIKSEVLIEARRKATAIKKMETLHVQELSEHELRKGACCSISESFETNASVDVSVPDPVSGQRRIQMLGLDGIYTQINLENIPYFQGISYAYGLASIPGTWADAIQITKGTGSVVHGYQSMAGMINLELKKDESHELFFLNGYGNRFGRGELNLQSARHIGKNKKWNSALFLHGSGVFSEVDINKDGFRDMPLSQTLSALNRWSYQGEKMEMKVILSGHQDNKTGGQLGYNPRESSSLFGSNIENRDVEAMVKMGIFLKNRPEGSIAFIAHGKYFTNSTYVGENAYDGEEARFYFNSIYSDEFSEKWKLKTGLSFVAHDFNESFTNRAIPTREMQRTELVTGAFGEMVYETKKWNIIAGLRGDAHNLFGFIPSPRLHMKYSPDSKTDFRFSAGRAWRVPNFVADNTNLLASNRIWLYLADLEPEISWNIGGSIVRSFALFQWPSQVTLDYFHTRFEQQLILDMENQFFIAIYNLDGLSYSNTVQLELTTEPTEGLELRFIYKYTDVKTTFGGVFQQRMMLPQHRGLFNAAYRTPNEKWEFDFTANIMGMMRLTPYTNENGVEQPMETEIFPILNTQITRMLGAWEIYAGGENLTNMIQDNAIMSADNPFGDYFDATRIFAPISGINVYLGFRYKIARK